MNKQDPNCIMLDREGIIELKKYVSTTKERQNRNDNEHKQYREMENCCKCSPVKSHSQNAQQKRMIYTDNCKTGHSFEQHRRRKSAEKSRGWNDPPSDRYVKISEWKDENGYLDKHERRNDEEYRDSGRRDQRWVKNRNTELKDEDKMKTSHRNYHNVQPRNETTPTNDRDNGFRNLEKLCERRKRGVEYNRGKEEQENDVYYDDKSDHTKTRHNIEKHRNYQSKDKERRINQRELIKDDREYRKDNSDNDFEDMEPYQNRYKKPRDNYIDGKRRDQYYRSPGRDHISRIDQQYSNEKFVTMDKRIKTNPNYDETEHDHYSDVMRDSGPEEMRNKNKVNQHESDRYQTEKHDEHSHFDRDEYYDHDRGKNGREKRLLGRRWEENGQQNEYEDLDLSRTDKERYCEMKNREFKLKESGRDSCYFDRRKAGSRENRCKAQKCNSLNERKTKARNFKNCSRKNPVCDNYDYENLRYDKRTDQKHEWKDDTQSFDQSLESVSGVDDSMSASKGFRQQKYRYDDNDRRSKNQHSEECQLKARYEKLINDGNYDCDDEIIIKKKKVPFRKNLERCVLKLAGKEEPREFVTTRKNCDKKANCFCHNCLGKPLCRKCRKIKCSCCKIHKICGKVNKELDEPSEMLEICIPKKKRSFEPTKCCSNKKRNRYYEASSDKDQLIQNDNSTDKNTEAILRKIIQEFKKEVDKLKGVKEKDDINSGFSKIRYGGKDDPKATVERGLKIKSVCFPKEKPSTIRTINFEESSELSSLHPKNINDSLTYLKKRTKFNNKSVKDSLLCVKVSKSDDKKNVSYISSDVSKKIIKKLQNDCINTVHIPQKKKPNIVQYNSDSFMVIKDSSNLPWIKSSLSILDDNVSNVSTISIESIKRKTYNSTDLENDVKELLRNSELNEKCRGIKCIHNFKEKSKNIFDVMNGCVKVLKSKTDLSKTQSVKIIDKELNKKEQPYTLETNYIRILPIKNKSSQNIFNDNGIISDENSVIQNNNECDKIVKKFDSNESENKGESDNNSPLEQIKTDSKFKLETEIDIKSDIILLSEVQMYNKVSLNQNINSSETNKIVKTSENNTESVEIKQIQTSKSSKESKGKSWLANKKINLFGHKYGDNQIDGQKRKDILKNYSNPKTIKELTPLKPNEIRVWGNFLNNEHADDGKFRCIDDESKSVVQNYLKNKPQKNDKNFSTNKNTTSTSYHVFGHSISNSDVIKIHKNVEK